jgi:hypothetical protein
MLSAHHWLAIAILGVTAVSALLGFLALARRRAPGRGLQHLLALGQTLIIGQVALGLLLLGDHRRAPDQLHYAYGTFALLAVLSPWMYAPTDPRRRLVWFSSSTLVATLLAVRAYMTA